MILSLYIFVINSFSINIIFYLLKFTFTTIIFFNSIFDFISFIISFIDMRLWLFEIRFAIITLLSNLRDTIFDDIISTRDFDSFKFESLSFSFYFLFNFVALMFILWVNFIKILIRHAIETFDKSIWKYALILKRIIYNRILFILKVKNLLNILSFRIIIFTIKYML